LSPLKAAIQRFCHCRLHLAAGSCFRLCIHPEKDPSRNKRRIYLYQ